MKLRVALWVTAFGGMVAIAQPNEWRFGPYDKLRPMESPRVESFKLQNKGIGGVVVFAPAENKSGKAKPVSLSITNQTSGSSVNRVNDFQLAPTNRVVKSPKAQ